ncbi:MAG: SDR family NAD(P)-dependent oxidoreductase [SAR324 cluster bacterium]|nr:SDR family NAD(P)-dependent oxidoreductase [SAR324 cluster bacterium]
MSGGNRLQGKSAVITGAGQGIGRAIALAFAGQGAALCLVDANPHRLPEVAEAAQALGVEVLTQQADVTQPEQVEHALQAAQERLGVPHILVNNAGIFQSVKFLDYGLDDWRRMLEVNVTGTFNCAQAALRRMVPEGRGKVINMASVAGKTAAPASSAYNTSKHAVIGLTRCLALEMARHGIQVNAICPGMVDTDLFDGLLVEVGANRGFAEPEALRKAMLKGVPLGRMISPQEVAQLAVYLASPDSDAMTGQALTLSGGHLMV